MHNSEPSPDSCVTQRTVFLFTPTRSAAYLLGKLIVNRKQFRSLSSLLLWLHFLHWTLPEALNNLRIRGLFKKYREFWISAGYVYLIFYFLVALFWYSYPLLMLTKVAHFNCLVNFWQLMCLDVFWLICVFYLFKKMDHRICRKFRVRNKIKFADAFRMLTVAYSEATLKQGNGEKKIFTNK